MKWYQFALILIVCLAAGVHGGHPADGFTRGDVENLNRFLNTWHIYINRERDFALLEMELENLDDGAQRAAQAILTLRHIEECNQDILALLANIETSGLNEFAHDRCRMMSTPLAVRVAVICGQYLERAVDDRYNQLLASDDNVIKLLQVLGKAHKTVSCNMCIDPSGVVENVNLLKRLSAGDGTPIKRNRANFDRFFDAHIVQPCKRLTSALEDLYKQVRLVANVQFNWIDFNRYRGPSFKNIMWAYRSCEHFLSMDDERLLRLFEMV